MLACFCLQQVEPVKGEKKTEAKPKKVVKKTFNKLAPSILIINY